MLPNEIICTRYACRVPSSIERAHHVRDFTVFSDVALARSVPSNNLVLVSIHGFKRRFPPTLNARSLIHSHGVRLIDPHAVVRAAACADALEGVVVAEVFPALSSTSPRHAPHASRKSRPRTMFSTIFFVLLSPVARFLWTDIKSTLIAEKVRTHPFLP